ncbi:MAG TPA: hypothetical protein VN883_16580 [Myxococcales bacterium]|nr:hypothetical protein [Myxococcales bacterium]
MRRPGIHHLWLGAVLLAGALPRVFLALTDDGIYWPDEVYQTIEPAHRLVFGYGMIAHEFVIGSRSWFLPGVIALPLELWKLCGGTQPHAALVLVKLCFAAISVAAAWSVHRLARALGAQPLTAVASAALFSLMAPAIYFGFRALSETASTLPIALGFALALDPRSSRLRRAAGASLLGLSVLLRLQNGIFGAALVLALLLRRRLREAGDALLVLSLWALAYGLLDLVTWGRPFHSAAEYLRFNVSAGGASQWGVASAWYYAETLWRSSPLPFLCLALLAPLSLRRAPEVLFAALAFAVAHSLVPHKELRFLLPALPLFCALAALGLEEAARTRALRLALPAAVLLCAAVDGLHFHRLRFRDLGQYLDVKPDQPAYQDFAQVTRLLFAAHDRKDLCGLKMEGVDLVWSFGYSALHRPVPLYQHDRPPSRESGRFNYVIAVQGRAAGAVVAEDFPYALVRVGDACAPDPGYQPLLR